jgi:hypothetical protein
MFWSFLVSGHGAARGAFPHTKTNAALRFAFPPLLRRHRNEKAISAEHRPISDVPLAVENGSRVHRASFHARAARRSEPSGGRMQSQVMHVAMLALGAMIIIWLVAEVTSRA